MPETNRIIGTKKGDFVEIEFTGRTNGEIFDTNIKSESEKINPNAEVKPLIAIIGEGMLISGFDKALEGKCVGEKYSIHLKQEEAYGSRNPSLIKMIPKRAFLEHKMNPVAGMTLALDNALAKIISVSGGRVMVDFNNPLAGKELDFDFTITKKLETIKEKVTALQEIFFKQVFEFDLDEKAKKIIFKDIKLTQILNIFRQKFKELVGFDVEILAKKNGEGQKQTEKPEKSLVKTP